MKNLFYCIILTFTLPVVVMGQTRGKLVINEVDYDQPSHDTAEFLEILNRSAATVELSFYNVELVNGTGGGAKVYGRFQLPSRALVPGGYFVLCADKQNVPNCDSDLLKSIQNGSPDAIALKLNNTIVDVLSYEGNAAAPYFEGDGSGLVDAGTGGVGGPNENMGLSRFPDGADTDVNKDDFSPRCVSPGLPNVEEAGDCTVTEQQ